MKILRRRKLVKEGYRVRDGCRDARVSLEGTLMEPKDRPVVAAGVLRDGASAQGRRAYGRRASDLRPQAAGVCAAEPAAATGIPTAVQLVRRVAVRTCPFRSGSGILLHQQSGRRS